MQEQEQKHPQIKVFTTPELLEIILLYLDTRTLLVSAQRVCQTLTALIRSSPAIQQALFFQPNKQEKWYPKSIWKSMLPSALKKDPNLYQGSINGSELAYPRRIYNPLLVQAFRPFFPSVHEYPFIHGENVPETEEKERKEPFSFQPLDMISSSEKKTAYARQEASWRKMLLCQPPVNGEVTVFKMYHAMGGDSYEYQVSPKSPISSNDKTLKMGHFFATLVQDPDLYFGRFGQTCVYWSAYVPPYEPRSDGPGHNCYPPEEGSFYPPVKKGFARAIKKSEVVVYSREVIQCCNGDDELTHEESLRKKIAEAEMEASKV
ncbi:hypothetical protein N7512_007789 [Penicillium capsulatum]|nr:hypothetical protein N7512_007789 [Penicillium capsulatum]